MSAREALPTESKATCAPLPLKAPGRPVTPVQVAPPSKLAARNVCSEQHVPAAAPATTTLSGFRGLTATESPAWSPAARLTFTAAATETEPFGATETVVKASSEVDGSGLPPSSALASPHAARTRPSRNSRPIEAPMPRVDVPGPIGNSGAAPAGGTASVAVRAPARMAVLPARRSESMAVLLEGVFRTEVRGAVADRIALGDKRARTCKNALLQSKSCFRPLPRLVRTQETEGANVTRLRFLVLAGALAAAVAASGNAAGGGPGVSPP